MLDAELLRQDARLNPVIYATYGISVFAARDLSVDELPQQAPLIRFAQLTLMTAGALRAAGLRSSPPAATRVTSTSAWTSSTTASPGYWPPLPPFK